MDDMTFVESGPHCSIDSNSSERHTPSIGAVTHCGGTPAHVTPFCSIEAAEPIASESDRWEAYCRAKGEFLRTHPKATPEQIEGECQRLAERLGL